MSQQSAGFVLAGGASRRMGSDKGLLDRGGGVPLVEHVARIVASAAGEATIIGPVERYQHLGRKVIEDLTPGLGPLGGIATALSVTSAEWNLVVACDMPALDAARLRGLLESAMASGALATAAAGPRNLPEPLCAVYHRDAREAVLELLAEGHRKAALALERLRAQLWQPPDTDWLRNTNTQEEWSQFTHGR